MSRVDFSGRSIKWNNTNDAYELLEAIKDCENLQEINLSGNVMSVEAAISVSSALEQKSSIKKVYLNDLFTGKSMDVIDSSLKCIFLAIIASGAEIEEINLSDNALGHKGVEALSRLIKSPSCHSLRSLILNNNGFGLIGALCGRNRLEDDGVECIASALQTINLNDNLLVENGAIEFGTVFISIAVKNMKCLRDLDLGDCLIRNKGARAIIESLKECHELTKLNLGYNEITTEVGLATIKCVSKLNSFELLNLDGNQFGQSGLDQIYFEHQSCDKVFAISLEEDEGEPDESEGAEDKELLEQLQNMRV
ncbi:hypothetical protein HZS_3901 [Henneguya salminicola]|nr:hypothetical protein HZS_3901 [Henneguya salminicola]